MSDELKAMEAPQRERRRLTFVKGGLFHDLAKARFERDVDKTAGEGNIDRVFFFNSGNGKTNLDIRGRTQSTDAG